MLANRFFKPVFCFFVGGLCMRILEKAIKEKGEVLSSEILKVGSFLNNQIDVKLLNKIGKEFYKHFGEKKVTKILTVESSGIALAVVAAQYFDCDVVFAKKSKSNNLKGELYQANCFSFTHGNMNILIIPKEYINSKDRILVIDDFLAHGEAVRACMQIVKQAGAEVVGVGIAIEKGFQHGGDELRAEGVDLYSAAIVDKMSEKRITFRKDED